MLASNRQEILPARMKFFMNSFEAVLVDMGVDLCGCDVRMAKHHLHRSKVCSMGEEVGGKGVSEHMRGDILFYSTLCGDCPEYLPET